VTGVATVAPMGGTLPTPTGPEGSCRVRARARRTWADGAHEHECEKSGAWQGAPPTAHRPGSGRPHVERCRVLQMQAAMNVRAPVGVACSYGGVRTRSLTQGFTARARCPPVQHRSAGGAAARVAQRRPLSVASEAGVAAGSSDDVDTRVAHAKVRVFVRMGCPPEASSGRCRRACAYRQPPATSLSAADASVWEAASFD